MLADIQNFPDQFSHKWEPLEGLKPVSGRVFASGMGGSTLPADLLNDFYGPGTLVIVRNYSLPKAANPSDLVISCSYSGNTEETLACFEEAVKKGIPQVVLSHGGKLMERAIAENIPVLRVPDSIQPRCAIGHFFTAYAHILEKAGKLPSQASAFKRAYNFLDANRERHEGLGRELSKKLKGRVPIVYGPAELEGMARIWKIKFNENAKIQSFYNVFPEVNHNEMVGYTQLLMDSVIIYLKSQFMHPRIRTRMDILQDILQDRIPFLSVELQGSSLLEEVFDANVIADYASYYLAAEYGIEAAPVVMVETFKKRL